MTCPSKSHKFFAVRTETLQLSAGYSGNSNSTLKAVSFIYFMRRIASRMPCAHRRLRQNQSNQGGSKIVGGAVFLRKTALGSSGLPFSNSDFAFARSPSGINHLTGFAAPSSSRHTAVTAIPASGSTSTPCIQTIRPSTSSTGQIRRAEPVTRSLSSTSFTLRGALV